jgi:PilZ domain-containing protein
MDEHLRTTSVAFGGIERRAFVRTGTSQHGIISARVRLGYRAAVVNVSPGGVLIDISKRLLPGATVDLQIETLRDRATVPGRVVRSAIIRLRANLVSYRVAIAFDRPWHRFSDSGDGPGVPGPPGRESTTGV